MLAPPGELAPPPREILDPPLIWGLIQGLGEIFHFETEIQLKLINIYNKVWKTEPEQGKVSERLQVEC